MKLRYIGKTGRRRVGGRRLVSGAEITDKFEVADLYKAMNDPDHGHKFWDLEVIDEPAVNAFDSIEDNGSE
jgi:hypothetical protein